MNNHKTIKIDSEKIGWAVFYLSMATVAVWIVLKLAGVIKSPIWQEVIPMLAFLTGLFAIALTMGKSLGLIKPMHDSLIRVEDKLDKLDKEYHHHIGKYHVS